MTESNPRNFPQNVGFIIHWSPITLGTQMAESTNLQDSSPQNPQKMSALMRKTEANDPNLALWRGVCSVEEATWREIQLGEEKSLPWRGKN